LSISKPGEPNFYTSIDQAAQKAADQIVPHIMDLISPNRVVDIGCGLGAWLTTFQLNGATEILGVDNNYSGFWTGEGHLNSGSH